MYWRSQPNMYTLWTIKGIKSAQALDNVYIVKLKLRIWECIVDHKIILFYLASSKEPRLTPLAVLL